MAIIKSFTSLEQSRKLAEILPLESADMYYPWYIEEDGDTIESGHRITTPDIGNFTTHKINKMILPCWSLAALMDVLPDEVGDNHYLTLDKEGKEYCCCYEDNNGNSFRHCFSDNPIDACVDMIENLHKQKLL